jgi:hypothetical protein
MSCGCGCKGRPGGCGDSEPYPVAGLPNQTGLGQTNTVTPVNYTPWVVGGILVAGVLGYFAYEDHKKHEGMGAQENPRRKQWTPDGYQLAVANVLVKQYGFSPGKANQAVNDSEIGWKLAWLYQHNYTVRYAAKLIHNRAKKKLYGEWKSAGYLPLRKDMPSYSGPLAGGYSSPFRKSRQTSAAAEW